MSCPPTSNGRKLAISAGRLLPWKGLSLAIRALEFVPEWDLLIVGDGSDAERLRRLTDRRKLGDRVRFLPAMEQDQVWELLQTAHALMLPSLRDDSPLIAAEAQTLGVPVVALQQGGPAALAIAPGARFELVPLGSVETCIYGIAQALDRLGRQEAREPSRAFSLDRVASDLNGAYNIVAFGRQEAREPSRAFSLDSVAGDLDSAYNAVAPSER